MPERGTKLGWAAAGLTQDAEPERSPEPLASGVDDPRPAAGAVAIVEAVRKDVGAVEPNPAEVGIVTLILDLAGDEEAAIAVESQRSSPVGLTAGAPLEVVEPAAKRAKAGVGE